MKQEWRGDGGLSLQRTSAWPATYKGVAIGIRTLPDGTFVGETATGYCTSPSVDIVVVLEAVTSWIDVQVNLPSI